MGHVATSLALHGTCSRVFHQTMSDLSDSRFSMAPAMWTFSMGVYAQARSSNIAGYHVSSSLADIPNCFGFCTWHTPECSQERTGNDCRCFLFAGRMMTKAFRSTSGFSTEEATARFLRLR